jgi:hypothetical protein
MNFFVNSVVAHSAKANFIEYTFTNTNTILDGCIVSGYAPKSVELTAGVEQNIPYFVASGIFGFCGGKNIKSLEKQLQAKAPAGQKRAWRAKARELFYAQAELNVEPAEDEIEITGEFLGEVGQKLDVELQNIECVHTSNWVDRHSWRHTGDGWAHPSGEKVLWRFTTKDGNILMFSSYGNVTNEKLSDAKSNSTIHCVVDAHGVFRGVRQTWVKAVKIKSIE